MAKRNAAAPNQDAAAADSFSPRVPASTVPSNIPADSTRNARYAYCRLMSEPVNPMARSTAMEYRSFAVSIFMNNNVTSNTMTAETRPAIRDAAYTDCWVPPKVCSMYWSIPETFA